MNLSIEKFKEFAGWGVKSAQAQGVLEVSRADLLDKTLVELEKGTRFICQPGIPFLSTETLEIGPDQTSIEVAVTAEAQGQAGNIPANRLWQDPRNSNNVSAIRGLLVSNPAAFTGGVDSVNPRQMEAIGGVGKTPEDIQKHLNSAMSIVLGLLGYEQTEALPEHDRIELAVYILCLYLSENRSTQERDLNLPGKDGPFLTRKDYYRARLEPAIFRRVTGLINPWRRVSAFMPGVSA